MDPEGAKKRVTPGNVALTLAFVAVIQVAALYLTYVNEPVTAQGGYSFAPAGTSSVGSVWNALSLVLVVFATTVVAVWLVRHRRVKVFMSIVFVGTALALFLLTLLTAIDITASYMDEYTSFYISLAVAAAVVVSLALTTFKPRTANFAPLITGLLSAEVGSYFASTIPFLTALLLPAAFSLYDIYAVFRGPLRQLINAAPAETLTAVSSKVGDLTLGTGDTIFYSMLPAIAFIQIGVASAVYTIIAVDVGVALTLYLLSRSKLLPGLPIPMALGLAAVVLSFLL